MRRGSERMHTWRRTPSTGRNFQTLIIWITVAYKASCNGSISVNIFFFFGFLQFLGSFSKVPFFVSFCIKLDIISCLFIIRSFWERISLDQKELLVGSNRNYHYLSNFLKATTGFSLRRPGFSAKSVHVEFEMDKLTLVLVVLRGLLYSSVSVIPPLVPYTFIHISPTLYNLSSWKCR